ncbi:Competence protein F [Rubrivivax sp. A210]|uniref:ComF family protein n=1 Tax=Rubrivivax sp. A210 TaxID=2772301 RepID=UPI00199772A3|nr:ComF family protein [Rubrivivax sp. A210]CAD5372671.1 Competence protein F [Rubrivivax sp. A210]
MGKLYIGRMRRPFMPGQCEICRQWTSAALCTDCMARFGAPRPRCRRCALPLGLAAAACGECLRQPPPFEAAVCAVDYGFPWDRVIADFKFHGRSELAGVLAGPLLDALAVAALPRVAAVLPVPLAPPRLAERGYNQAWELARRLAAALGLPAHGDLLQRTLDTAHQAGLPRTERQRNLAGAFMVDPRRRNALQGRALALVDDVMTTGATLREAAAQLLRAGAASVQVWVVARTPTPGD